MKQSILINHVWISSLALLRPDPLLAIARGWSRLGKHVL